MDKLFCYVLDPIEEDMKLGELTIWAKDIMVRQVANDENYDPPPEVA